MAIERIKQIDSSEWKGLVLSLSGYQAPEGALLDADNVELVREYLRRSRLLEGFAGSLTGTPLAIIPYQLADGSYQLVCITSDVVYSYTSSAVGWVNKGTYTGAATRRVSHDAFAGTLIFSDETNYVKKYDGTTLTDLGGLTATLARGVVSFWSFLFLLHTIESAIENPHRVKWSNIGNAEDYSTGLAGFVDLLDSWGEVQTGAVLGNRIFIYKDYGIYAGTYVGLPRIFDFYPIPGSVGIAAPGSLARAEQYHLFLGEDNVYAFDGNTAQAIGEPVAEWIVGPRRRTTANVLTRSIGAYIPYLREYWLAVPVDQDTTPTMLLRYHLPTQTWWPRTKTSTYLAFGAWYDTDLVTWNDLGDTATWNDFGASETWDELGGLSQAVRIPLIGTLSGTSGQLQRLDETSPSSESAYYTTKDYLFHTLTRILEYRLEAKGAAGQLTVSYSTDEGTTWTSLGANTLTGSEWQWAKWPLNITADVIRFKVELSAHDISVRKRTLIGIEKRR